MLKANKSGWFEWLFAFYNRNLLKRRFHSLNITNLNELREQKPQIIYLNHSSWWDGLIAFELSQIIKADSFVMMEEKHLKKLFLFRRLGAFSVVREDPRQAIQSIDYAVKLLRENPSRTVWIFPQGEILPNDRRPFHFYRGLARIVEKVGGCIVIPCAIRYEFLGDFKPEIFVKIGQAEHYSADGDFKPKNLTSNFERQMTENLDSLKRNVTAAETANYERIF